MKATQKSNQFEGEIMKKTKDPIKKRWTKLRSAIRNVWQYDPSRKQFIEQAKIPAAPGQARGWYFKCPLCKGIWPIELATVDHEPELGGFDSWETFFSWTRRCFEGPQRAICKMCHKRKPRKKK